MSGFLSLLFSWINSAEGLRLIQENLPKLLAFASSLNTSIAEAKAKGLGHDEAVAEVAAQVALIVQKAAEAAAHGRFGVRPPPGGIKAARQAAAFEATGTAWDDLLPGPDDTTQ